MSIPVHVVWWGFKEIPVYLGHEGLVEGGSCNYGYLLGVFNGLDCVHTCHFAELPPNVDGAIVVINGKWQPIDCIDRLNSKIDRLGWVVVVSLFDQESAIRLDLLKHPNLKVWVQEPKPGTQPNLEPGIPLFRSMQNHDQFRRIPTAPSHDFQVYLPEFQNEMKEKPLDWFFAGRNDDPTRQDWARAIRALPLAFPKGKLCAVARGLENEGIVSALSPREYVRFFASARVIPCRPASCTPETSRTYEALEAGCVPIVTDVPGSEGWKIRFDWSHHWEYVLGEKPPFPVIHQPEQLATVVQTVLESWDYYSQLTQAWWKRYKRRRDEQLTDDVLWVREVAAIRKGTKT